MEENDAESETESIESELEDDIIDDSTHTIIRNIESIIPDDKRISRNILTQYEITAVLSFRVQQLANGSQPYVQRLAGSTYLETATEELEQKKIPFIIRRHQGNKTEYWRLSEMIVNL